MADNQNMSRIASRIREAREYLDVSVCELAQMVGLSESEVEDIESGKMQITAASLAEVAKAVGRGLDFFTSDIPAQKAAERTEFLARAAETLSDQDLDELQRFAKYLRSRSESVAA